MGIEVKTNFDPSKLADDIKEKQLKEMGRIMAEMAEKIVTRSRAQTDADGKRFAPLSKPYAKRKQRSGRAAVPDLTFSGKMLAAIDSKVEQIGNSLVGRIFFNSVKEAEKARGNMKIRKFFALSRDQIQTIIERLKTL